MRHRLYKSSEDVSLTGVCGGLAEYFSVDATLIRVGFVFSAIFTGFFPGVLLYFVLFMLMPDSDE